LTNCHICNGTILKRCSKKHSEPEIKSRRLESGKFLSPGVQSWRAAVRWSQGLTRREFNADKIYFLKLAFNLLTTLLTLVICYCTVFITVTSLNQMRSFYSIVFIVLLYHRHRHYQQMTAAILRRLIGSRHSGRVTHMRRGTVQVRSTYTGRHIVSTYAAAARIVAYYVGPWPTSLT